MHKYQASSQILQQIKNDHYNKDQCQVEDILDRQLRKDVNRMMGEEDKKISMEDLYSYIMRYSCFYLVCPSQSSILEILFWNKQRLFTKTRQEKSSKST